MAGSRAVREKAEALIARIERLEPDVNAFVAIDRETILRDADRVDTIPEERRGPLYGMALAIKDLVDAVGFPTRVGSSFFCREPAVDAPIVARLREAGAFVIGKTITHEFAWGITSENPHTGRVRNPWDLARIAGGSSGGSGAALAAGLCDLAIGTDTLGSIRIPCSATNGSGIRPASGSVPMDGIFPLAPTLDVAGPMANDVVTVREALAAMSATPIGCEPLPQRVARLRGGGWEAIDEAMMRALDEACDALRALGIAVEELSWWDDALIAATTTLQRFEAARVHRQFREVDRSAYGPDVRTLLDGAAAVSQADADASRATIAVARRGFDERMRNYGAVFAPMLAGEAPRSPVHANFRPNVIPRAVPATAFALPVLALPIGFGAHGLPMGMQVIGTTPDPAPLFALGERYQEATSWHRRRPPLAVDYSVPS
jgi:aspartyl-tRNA(Asn)/glutamyl-tRNA(Gln) amidotransferase subunit A